MIEVTKFKFELKVGRLLHVSVNNKYIYKKHEAEIRQKLSNI